LNERGYQGRGRVQKQGKLGAKGKRRDLSQREAGPLSQIRFEGEKTPLKEGEKRRTSRG